MPDRPSDAAWRLIVQARGSVRGKVFRMTRGRLAAILRYRGEGPVIELRGRSLYGVPVVTDDFLPYDRILLEER